MGVTDSKKTSSLKVDTAPTSLIDFFNNTKKTRKKVIQEMMNTGYTVLRMNPGEECDIMKEFRNICLDFFRLSQEKKELSREETKDEVLRAHGQKYNNMGYVKDKFKEYIKLRRTSSIPSQPEGFKNVYFKFLDQMEKISVEIFKIIVEGNLDQETIQAYVDIAKKQSSAACLHYWKQDRLPDSEKLTRSNSGPAGISKDDTTTVTTTTTTTTTTTGTSTHTPTTAPAPASGSSLSMDPDDKKNKEDIQVMKVHIDTGLITVVCIMDDAIPGLQLHDRSKPCTPGNESFDIMPEKTLQGFHLVIHTGGKLGMICPDIEAILHRVVLPYGVERHSILYYMDVSKN